MIDRTLRPAAVRTAIKPDNRAFKVSSSRLMNDQPPSNSLHGSGVAPLFPCPPARSARSRCRRYPNAALDTREVGRRLEDTFNEVSRTRTLPDSGRLPSVSIHRRRHPGRSPCLSRSPVSRYSEFFFRLLRTHMPGGRFRCASSPVI